MTMLLQILQYRQNRGVDALLKAYSAYQSWGDDDMELVIIYTRQCEDLAKSLQRAVESRGYFASIKLKQVVEGCDWLINKYNSNGTVRIVDELGNLYSKIDYYIKFKGKQN